MSLSHSEEQKNFYNTSFQKIATPSMETTIRKFYVEKLISLVEENKLIPPGSKILEVGCGEGLVMQQLADHYKGCSFSGVDISDKNIARAKARSLNVRIGDANMLETDEKFDLIYGTAILHHLENIGEFFARIRRFLKPKGAILFGAEPERREYFYVLYHRIRGSWEIEKGMMNISSTQMRQDLSPYFQEVRIYHHGNPFVYCSRILGKTWNATKLSGLPYLNDIYIVAKNPNSND